MYCCFHKLRKYVVPFPKAKKPFHLSDETHRLRLGTDCDTYAINITKKQINGTDSWNASAAQKSKDSDRRLKQRPAQSCWQSRQSRLGRRRRRRRPRRRRRRRWKKIQSRRTRCCSFARLYRGQNREVYEVRQDFLSQWWVGLLNFLNFQTPVIVPFLRAWPGPTLALIIQLQL